MPQTNPQHERYQASTPQNPALPQATLRLMALLELAKIFNQI
jgi:hypothetical protein